MAQMDPMVCGVDGLQSAGIVNAVHEVTTALDAVMDCVEVSAGVDPSTEPVEVKVNAGRCLFCCRIEIDCESHCCFFYKGELK
jgi:hypothetical protein